MKYQIKPYFKIEDEKYWILSVEIGSLLMEELKDIIEDIECIFSGKYDESSFSGKVVSIVRMRKDLSSIWYYEEEIGTCTTQEIYEMLKELYKSKKK
jgi:hypothetical protein